MRIITSLAFAAATLVAAVSPGAASAQNWLGSPRTFSDTREGESLSETYERRQQENALAKMREDIDELQRKQSYRCFYTPLAESC
jgi:hypothetical protein